MLFFALEFRLVELIRERKRYFKFIRIAVVVAFLLYFYDPLMIRVSLYIARLASHFASVLAQEPPGTNGDENNDKV